MKKILCFFVLSGFLLCGSLFAAKGGFFDTSQSRRPDSDGYRYTSVKEAKLLPDGSKVRLIGTIRRHISDDKYEFVGSEPTRSFGDVRIVVEIDDDKWSGQTVTPDDVVIILGEIDKDDGDVIIDVKQVRKDENRTRERQAALSDSRKSAPGCNDCGCATGSR